MPDATWRSILSKENFRTEFKIAIHHSETSIREFLSDKIVDFQITRPLFSKYEVGNATCAQLVFTLDSTLNPQAGAEVDVFARVVANDEISDWINYGVFYIDSRRQDPITKFTTFTAYDDMYKAEAILKDVLHSSVEFPHLFASMAGIIAGSIGISIEESTLNYLNSLDFYVEYPNELTMREVLGYIAAGAGGNFFINTSRELQLAFSTSYLGGACEIKLSDTAYVDIGREKAKFNKLRVWYDDENAFEKGTGNNVFEIDCPWATQAMCDYLFTYLRTEHLKYRPFTFNKCSVSPLVELNDSVWQNDNNIEANIGNIVIYGNGLMDISAPDDSEVTSELDYKGSYQKQLERKVTLGADYYGTSITREKGIVVNRVGADESIKAQVILNADEFAFYNNGAKKLYFDISNGEYVFEGKITADSGEIAGLVINKDDNNRGYIATKGKTSAGQGEGIFLSYNEFGIGGNFYVGSQGNLETKNAKISGRFDAILNTTDIPNEGFQNGIYFYNGSKSDTNLIGGIWYSGEEELYINTTNYKKLKLYSSGNSSYDASAIYMTGGLETTGITCAARVNCISQDQYNSSYPVVDINAEESNEYQASRTGKAQILLVGGAASKINLNANTIGFFGSPGINKPIVDYTVMTTEQILDRLIYFLNNLGLIDFYKRA